MTGDKMVGWHHQLNGHESEQASGVGDGQGSLACCSPWGRNPEILVVPREKTPTLKEGQDSTPGFASSPCQGSACSEVLPTLVQRAPGWKPHLASCEVRATSIPEKMIAHTPSLR